MRIEEAAARRQAQIDSGREMIVGVNKYRLEKEEPIEIREVDNTAVREAQIAQLKKLKAERDTAAVSVTLDAFTEAAATGTDNLLALAIEAARARATLGEISDALEKVWGRHKAQIRSITGVYGARIRRTRRSQQVRTNDRRICRDAKDAGRASSLPRWARTATTAARKWSRRPMPTSASTWISVRFSRRPRKRRNRRSENDVHVVGVSSLAAGHKTLVPQLIAELKALDR